MTTKLPTVMPDGTSTRKHPFLWCIKNRMGEDRNKSDLARHLGVRPQSIYKWEGCCRHDRNFKLPAERALEAARFFGVQPSLFRPDMAWPTGPSPTQVY
jgi:hypothetical protein